jgi:hypothetical protein
MLVASLLFASSCAVRPASTGTALTSLPQQTIAPSGTELVSRTSGPTEAAATPTIIYYLPAGGKHLWTKVPTILISSSPDDSRIPLVQEAADFWNQQFQAIGTPFHLGPVAGTSVSFPDADLKAIGDPSAPGKLSGGSAKLLAGLPGDIVIVLSEANFISVTHAQGGKFLVAIQGHPGQQVSANEYLNTVAHELGHAMGLGHNSDPDLLMCGRPATCRPGQDQFTGAVGIAPLSVAERALLLQLYPPDWTPSG